MNRVPPHDLDAERSLLGACLLSANAIDAAVAASVTPADFYKAAHGNIYGAVIDLREQGDDVDPITVAAYLNEQRHSKPPGIDNWGPYLVALQTATPAISNAAAYAKIVKDRARLRSLIGVAGKIADLGYGASGAWAATKAALQLVEQAAATAIASEDDAGLTARGMRIGLAVRTTEQVLTMPTPEYLIDGWIVNGALVCIYGKPATFKSLVAQSWAFCFATGTAWHGHTVTPSRVLYVAAEGSGGLAKRIKAWCDDTGTPPADAAELLWLPMSVNLLDDELADGLIAAAEERAAEVVVIDTVARSLPGAPENDGPSFSKLVAVADRLRELGMTVILVHHSPKEGGGMRGHTNLEGAVDTAIEAKRSPRDSVMTLSMTKQKDFAEADDITLKLRVVGDSVVLDFVPNGRGTLTANGEAVLAAIRDSDGTGRTASDVIADTGISRSTVNRIIVDLRKQHRIRDLCPNGVSSWVATEPDESQPSQAVPRDAG